MASEIIDQVPNLAISGQFHMADGYPMSHRNGIALYPAIAIPVETKQQYECPEEHLAVLREFIPKTTKILMIGWRATEDHFLKLLAAGITQKLKIMAVSGATDWAKQSVANLTNVGIDADAIESPNGFTAFIVSREGDEFLRS
jgi:hypothetical protein